MTVNNRWLLLKTPIILCDIQFHVLREYMDGGGCVLVLMTEGGEVKQNTNINFLLEEFGIMVNNGEWPFFEFCDLLLFVDCRCSDSYCLLQVFSS